MKIDLMLVAQGGFNTPTLNISLVETTDTRSREEASRIAGTLSLAGYSVFTVYNVADDNHHFQVFTLKVETPKPIVTIK